MRIDLLLVLGLENEDDLNRHQIVWVVFSWQHKLWGRIDRQLGGVLFLRVSSSILDQEIKIVHLEDMGYSVLTIDLFLHNTILVNSDGSENIEHGLVHRLKTVNDECHSNLLPARGSLLGMSPPVFRLFGLANITNVEHDTMERSGIQRLVLVVGCDSDENLRVTIVQFCAEGPAICFSEFVRVNCRRSVPHVTRQKQEMVR